jgi:RNA recognition motif-containing protein
VRDFLPKGDLRRDRLLKFRRSFLIARFREDREESEFVTNIFVGNLDITATEQQLRELLQPTEASKPSRSSRTGIRANPRGIAFVEMTQATEAQGAISALDGTMLNSRPMSVNEARPKLHRDPMRDSGRRDHRRHRM